MASQWDILTFLNRRKRRWFTLKELYDFFEGNQQNLARKVRRLNHFGFIDIQVEGKRFLIRRKKKDGRSSKR